MSRINRANKIDIILLDLSLPDSDKKTTLDSIIDVAEDILFFFVPSPVLYGLVD